MQVVCYTARKISLIYITNYPNLSFWSHECQHLDQIFCIFLLSLDVFFLFISIFLHHTIWAIKWCEASYMIQNTFTTWIFKNILSKDKQKLVLFKFLCQTSQVKILHKTYHIVDGLLWLEQRNIHSRLEQALGESFLQLIRDKRVMLQTDSCWQGVVM